MLTDVPGRHQVGNILLEQKEAIKSLEQSLQPLAVSFAGQSSSFDHLARLLQDEHGLTREHMSREIKQLEQRAAEAKRNQELLASLHFPEIYCREEEIKDPYRETFHWILDSQANRGNGEPSHPSFIDWLETGSGLYWVHGKAGCGKSTLMSYIWRDKRTIDYLKTWADTRELIVAGFFFWAAGTPMQKTLIGLLRSLAYQILQRKPDLINCLYSTSQFDSSNRSQAQFHEPFTIWTERKLLQCLASLTHEASPRCCICIFIDGLDEFSGDHWDLVQFLADLVKNTTIKCCASSRPERPFKSLGSTFCALRLEDHTKPDIKSYVVNKLNGLSQFMHFTEYQRYKIGQQILEKADGVFLWVEVAVACQIKRMRNGDDFDTLWSQLNALPDEVDGLYACMLDRIDPIYRAEAARYLRYALLLTEVDHFLRFSVFDLALLTYGLREDLQLKSLQLDVKTFISKCERIRERVELTCGGILEIRPGRFPSSEDFKKTYPSWATDEVYDIEIGFGWYKEKVVFHHRTTRDFFQAGKIGDRFLSTNCPAIPEMHFLRTALNFSRVGFCQEPIPWAYVCEILTRTFHGKMVGSGCSTVIPFCFMDYVDRSFGKVERPISNAHRLTNIQ